MNKLDIISEELKKACDEAYKDAGENAYFGVGFVSGVEFAQTKFSNAFKAKIESEILTLKTKLKNISEDVEMSFTNPENWKKEMHLINGKIDGLELSLNYA